MHRADPSSLRLSPSHLCPARKFHSRRISGNEREAQSILSKLEDLEHRSGGASWDLAVVEIGLGNKEKALAWLETAYREHHDDALLTLRVDPAFDPLRADPRFQDLLRRLKLSS